MGQRFQTVQELNRYRKGLAATRVPGALPEAV